MASRRALHFVFKIGDRKASAKFYKDILGMSVLRHEEFDESCKAACNGPYDGKWSKTMIGYGPEDNHFVCELTYNYGISQYELGNDFLGFYIESSEVLERARLSNWLVKQDGEQNYLEAPGGYKFYIIDKPQPLDKDPVQQIALSSSNLEQSIAYWHDIAGMTVYKREEGSAVLGYGDTQTKMVLRDIGCPVVHAKAFGRIAFACEGSELPGLEEAMKAKNQTILTPYVSLDTPGKTTVQVVILADPDGHEICFVGDEGFRSLSSVDPDGDQLFVDALEKDMSNEWFEKKGGKATA